MFQRSFINLLLLFVSAPALAQQPSTIRFAKDRQYIYFFQAGSASDTICRNRSDLFFYLVPDSIRRYIFLSSENAQFTRSPNDSLLKCIYLPGLRYETFFIEAPENKEFDKNSGIHFPMVLKTGINGASAFPRERILVQIIDRRSNKVLIENIFYGR